MALHNVRRPATLRVKTRFVRAPSGFDGERGGSGGSPVAAAWQRRARQSGSSTRTKEELAEVHNVVVVKFTDASKAYQALSVLKDCDAEGRIGLKSAAIVERTPDGELRIPRAGQLRARRHGERVADRDAHRRPRRPGGRSRRLGAGALMGGTIDIVGITKSEEALTAFGRAIPPESTAVIASVTEPAVEVIDGEMAKLDGEVTRRPVVEVMAELEAAEEAADAAARARKTLREKRRRS